MGVALFI